MLISILFVTAFFCCSFEQEVLGGPMPVSGNPPVLEAVPVALPLPGVVRPIIGTNTYRQVCTLLITQVLMEILTNRATAECFLIQASYMCVMGCINAVMHKYQYYCLSVGFFGRHLTCLSFIGPADIRSQSSYLCWPPTANLCGTR